MADFDGWLDRMISKAENIGEKKRKLFYGAKKEELNRQYGTTTTPYGPGYETQKLQNAGELEKAKLGADKDIKVAGMTADLEKKKLDLTSPTLMAENENIKRQKRIGIATNKIAIGDTNTAAKSILGLMEKSATAQSTVAKLEPTDPGWRYKFVEGASNIGKAGASLLYGLPNWNKTDVALEQKGLSREDILSPEKWAGLKKAQKEERNKKTLLKEY